MEVLPLKMVIAREWTTYTQSLLSLLPLTESTPRYPHGPARNPNSVQRGSVQFLSMYPGDPTTPGFPSYEDANRTLGESIPSIPSLPISWANAQVLLREIHQGGTNRIVRLVNHGTPLFHQHLTRF